MNLVGINYRYGMQIQWCVLAWGQSIQDMGLVSEHRLT